MQLEQLPCRVKDRRLESLEKLLECKGLFFLISSLLDTQTPVMMLILKNCSGSLGPLPHRQLSINVVLSLFTLLTTTSRTEPVTQAPVLSLI